MTRTIPRAVAALSVLAAFSAAPAFGASVSYFLDLSNVDAAPYPDGQNYLQVTISDGIGGNIDFLVQTLVPLSSNAGSNYGIQSFGFNTALSLSAANIINLPSGWTMKSSKKQDGFGNFVAVAHGTGNSRVDPLMFSITGISGDTPMDYVMLSTGTAGQGNTDFAAHVAGFSTQVTSAYFGGSTSVPEADTWGMLLVGLGLLGLRLRGRLEATHPIRA
jgi:hypothetical protein